MGGILSHILNKGIASKYRCKEKICFNLNALDINLFHEFTPPGNGFRRILANNECVVWCTTWATSFVLRYQTHLAAPPCKFRGIKPGRWWLKRIAETERQRQREFTKEEVKKCEAELKNRKAKGAGGIVNEFIKCGGEGMITVMIML